MATYYVDLSQAGTGDGSSGSPFNYTQFAAHSFLSGDIFKLKGSIDLGATAFVSISVDVVLEAWDLLLYGPWRIKSTTAAEFTITDTGAEISGAILYNVFNSILGVLIKNTYMYFSGVSFFEECTCKGCTFICSELGNESALVLEDCVLDISSYAFYSNVTVNNCVITIADTDPFFIDTNCQFSWTPPTWPAWDAAQSAFASTLLGVGINTPPEPGNPPYTDYATGLWGSARTGIGAMDFVEATTTTTTAAPTTTTTTAAPTTTTTTAAPTTTTTTAAPTTTTTTAAPTTTTTTTAAPTTLAPERRRQAHGPVITDGGPVSRSMHGNQLADYHTPWWLN